MNIRGRSGGTSTSHQGKVLEDEMVPAIWIQDKKARDVKEATRSRAL